MSFTSQDIVNLEKNKEAIHQEILNVVTSQKKIRNQISKQQLEIEKWNQKMTLANELGDELLASDALAKKNQIQDFILELEKRLESYQQEKEALSRKYRELEHQIFMLKTKNTFQQNQEQEEDLKTSETSSKNNKGSRQSLDNDVHGKKWIQKISKINLKIFITILLLLLILYVVFKIHTEGDSRIVGVVDRVIDGDTVVVKGMRVRLLNVDTEESVHPRRVSTEFGRITSAYVSKELTGKEVKLECHGQDIYGRSLCYVFVKNWLGDQLYNVELVREGWSKYYTRYGISQEYHDDFVEAENVAKNNQIGVWKK